jgi:hypothetical protein
MWLLGGGSGNGVNGGSSVSSNTAGNGSNNPNSNNVDSGSGSISNSSHSRRRRGVVDDNNNRNTASNQDYTNGKSYPNNQNSFRKQSKRNHNVNNNRMNTTSNRTSSKNDINEQSNNSKDSGGTNSMKPMNRRRTLRRDNNSTNNKDSNNHRLKYNNKISINKNTENTNLQMFDEVSGGIEISITHDNNIKHNIESHINKNTNHQNSSLSNINVRKDTKDLLVQQQLYNIAISCKIYRAQYNPNINSNMDNKNKSNQNPRSLQTTSYTNQKIQNFQKRNHRIPLFTTTTGKDQHSSSFASSNNNNNNTALSFDDMVFLLRSYDLVFQGELACIQDEISNLDHEINEISLDRMDITNILHEVEDEVENERNQIITHHNNCNNSYSNIPIASLIPTLQCKSNDLSRIFDIHQHLLVRPNQQYKYTNQLSNDQRSVLQNERGLNYTIHVQNKNNNNSKMIEALLSKCGSINTTAANNSGSPASNFFSQILGGTGSYNNESHTTNDNLIQITTQSCREGGAGTTIQHLTLLMNSDEDVSRTPMSNSKKNASFIISRDNGKSYFYGSSLPKQLHRRIIKQHEQQQKMYTKTNTNVYNYFDNIIYLSTGQYGTYYVEFRNGEKWWCIAENKPYNDNTNNSNDEFQNICYELDIHRIAFGPYTTTIVQDQEPFNKRIDGTLSTPSTATTTSFTNSTNSKLSSSLHNNNNNNNEKIHVSSSWMIISKDGKVAYKNIPTRLHNNLSNRIATDSAPMEVSLGMHGSYFIKFVDGKYKKIAICLLISALIPI